MKKKKIAIICLSIVALAVPLSAFLSVSILANQSKVSSSYIYKPDSLESQRLKKQISDTLDATIGKDGKLPIKFDTLTQENQYTAAQNSWFLELSAAFKWIDPRLSFERIPRSNATVERAFYNNNTMIRSFFWSADYHNVGTWVGYNFTDQFATTNLYPSLYEYSKEFQKDSTNIKFKFREYKKNLNNEIIYDESGRPELGIDFPEQYQPKNWIPDLSNHLYNFKIPDNFRNYYDAAPLEDKVPGIDTLDGLAPKNGGTENIPYFYSWEEFSKIDRAIQIGSKVLNGEKINNTLLVRDIIWNQIGYWADVKTSAVEKEQYWLGLVSWMNQQFSAIPYISDAGPNTTTISLATPGLHPVKNSNTENNYRDWFVDEKTNRNNFSHWSQTIPFDDTFTPFNPSFTRSPNYQYFQSTWNGLIDYKTKGDWIEKDKILTPPENKLFLQGAKSIDIKSSTGTLIHTIGGKDPNNIDTWYVNSEDIAASASGTIYDFKIPTHENEVFKWYGPNNELKGNLTAQDYFAGILCFILSSKWNYNKNGYYTSLFNLDIEKTIEANKHFFTSRPGDTDNPGAKKFSEMDVFKFVDNDLINTFTLIQSSPNVNTLDVLTKQYFNPLPYKNEGVKYILESSSDFLKIGENGTKTVDEQKGDFKNKVYGGSVNNGSNVSNWWSPGPYILNSSNGNSEMQFIKNDNFFNKFPENFFRTPNTKDVEKINMKFGKGYSVQNNYEQFIVKQVDTSLIPQANLSNSFNVLQDSIRKVGTEFLPRTNLLPFNTDIYQLDGYGLPLTDSEGKKVLKSFITKEYELAIVEDLHKGSEGNSYKIRSGIIELIDWYSLSSLATPNNTPYYQNSLVPYGNGKITSESKYLTFFETSLNKGNIGFTNIPYSQYQKNWEEQLK